MRVRAIVWACGRRQADRQTDTQTRVTTRHFSWSSTHAKCNEEKGAWGKEVCEPQILWAVIFLVTNYTSHKLKNCIVQAPMTQSLSGTWMYTCSVPTEHTFANEWPTRRQRTQILALRTKAKNYHHCRPKWTMAASGATRWQSAIVQKTHQ